MSVGRGVKVRACAQKTEEAPGEKCEEEDNGDEGESCQNARVRKMKKTQVFHKDG